MGGAFKPPVPKVSINNGQLRLQPPIQMGHTSHLDQKQDNKVPRFLHGYHIYIILDMEMILANKIIITAKSSPL